MANLQTTQDSNLEESVVKELTWVPDVDGSRIGVVVSAGVVTLLGEVASYSEKVRAAQATLRVHGVRGVAQELTVKTTWATTDADVARSASVALQATTGVPETVRAVVDDRVITLTGETNWQFQRMAAERAVEHLRGVEGVLNLTTIKEVPVPVDTTNRIYAALIRAAELDSKAITVTNDEHGAVTLKGSVHSDAARRSATRACWSAPGVTTVHDDLTVST